MFNTGQIVHNKSLSISEALLKCLKINLLKFIENKVIKKRGMNYIHHQKPC